MTEFELTKLYNGYLTSDVFLDVADEIRSMIPLEIGDSNAVIYPKCDVRFDPARGSIRLVGIPRWVPCVIPNEVDQVEWVGLVNNGVSFDVIFGVGDPFDGDSMLPMKDGVTIAVPRAWSDEPHFYYLLKTNPIKK